MSRFTLVLLFLEFFLGITSISLAEEIKPASSLRLALVSSTPSENINNLLDLAQAKLSGEPRLETLERKAIQRILAEQKLSLAGLVDSSLAVQAGKLLSANVFALIETDPQGKEALGLVVYDAETGIKWYDQTLAAAAVDQQVEAIAQAVRGVAKKRAAGPQGWRTLCILGTRNADLPRSQDHVVSTVAWLLERHLLTSPSLAVLERKRLDWVNKEKNLTGMNKELLASLVLVDVEISRAEKGIKATVYLSDSQGSALGKIKAESNTAKAQELANGLLISLVQALKAAPSGSASDRLRESQRFFQEGQHLVSHKHWQQAIQALEAAYALDGANGKIRDELAKALIARAFWILPPENNAKPQPVELVKQVLAGGARAYELRMLAAQQEGSTPAGLHAYHNTYYQTHHHLHYFKMPLLQKEFLDEECRDLVQQVFAAFVRMAEAELDQWARATKKSPTMGQWYMSQLSSFLGEIKNSLYFSDQDLERISLPWLEQWREVSLTPGMVLEPNAVNWLFHLHFDRAISFVPFYAKLAKHGDPLVQLWGRYLGLTVRRHQGKITANQAEQAYQDIKQTALETIEKYQPPAKPLASPTHDLRHGCYMFLTNTSRSWYAANPEARLRECFAVCDFMLRRKEIANSSFLATVQKDPLSKASFPNQRLQLIDRALALLDTGTPGLCVQPEFIHRELTRLRQTILQEHPELAKSPAKVASTLVLKNQQQLLRPQDMPGLKQAGPMVVEGDYIYLPIGRLANPIDIIGDIWLEILKISWKSPGKMEKFGQWKLPSTLPGERNLFGIRCSCWGEDHFYAGTQYGIFAFDVHGKVQVVHKDFDFPALATQAMAFHHGKLFVCLDGGYLLALDIKAHKYETLASSRRRERLSPFDDSDAFHLTGLLADPARDRLLMLLYQRPKPDNYSPAGFKDGTNGLWEYHLPTRKFTRHLELFYDAFSFATAMEREHWLLCGGKITDFDLKTNQVQFLLGKGTDGPSLFGPPLRPIPMSLASCQYYWKQGDFLWGVEPKSLSRLSLHDGHVTNVPGITTQTTGRNFFSCCSLASVNGNRLVLQNDTGLWLLEISDRLEP